MLVFVFGILPDAFKLCENFQHVLLLYYALSPLLMYSTNMCRKQLIIATTKNVTLCYPRDQVMDEGPVSSLRALL